MQGFTEAITRHTARGWARDPAAPLRRLRIQAVARGQVIAEAPADLYRGDVHDAGLGDGNCGFVLDLAPHADRLAGVPVTLRDAESGAVLPGSPTEATDPPSLANFLARWDSIPAKTLSRLRRMMRHRLRGQAVSVIAHRHRDLPALRASLQAQLAGTWELVIPPSAPPHDLVLVITGRATLERDALWHLLQAAADPRPAAFLWDSLRTHRTGAIDLLALPAFSEDTFRSHPVTPAYALRRPLSREAGGSSREADRTGGGLSAAHLLALATTHPIAHIPRPLHRSPDKPPAPTYADLRAIRRHLPANVTATLAPGRIVTTWPDPPGRTLAVIPTRNQAPLLRACLDSLLRTRADTPLDIVVIDHQSDEAETKAYLRAIAGLVTVMPYAGPFDFARMNNTAVARHGTDAETLLFLNNDTQALAPGWLARLRGLAARPDVGAVGALLLYPDRRVQHAGVVLGFDGSATHAHALETRAPTGTHEVTAVTAACMMLRRTVFTAAGGFDEAFPIGFNDTDLCLRLRARGYRILQDNETVLLHHESRSRKPAGQWLHPADTALFKSRHEAAIAAGDPFYNPNLRLDLQAHEPRPDRLPGGKPRLSVPGLSLPASPTPPGAAPSAPPTPRSAKPRPRRSSG